MVGVTKDRAEDSERCYVVEDGTQCDGRGLDGWEVWEEKVSMDLYLNVLACMRCGDDAAQELTQES